MRNTESGEAPGRAVRSPGSPHGPIDRAHIARFTLGNVALEREVLALFAGEAPRYLARLSEAATARDLIEAAHTLTGSARAVGASRVAVASEHVERLARGDGFDLASARMAGVLDAHVAELVQALDEALAAIATDSA